MINPPSCLVGNMPNNLDIDLNDVIQPNQPVVVANGSGQVDMNAMQGMFSMGAGGQMMPQPGAIPTQN